jgi:lipid-binding SYLF domain-containing protein
MRPLRQRTTNPYLNLLGAAVVALLVAACATTSSESTSSKQAEVRQATQKSLSKFYQANPQLQADVANAPGYAVFTTYGLSFIVGGAGGKGLVHNNQTGTDTFMDTAQASAGAQIGAAETDTLIIFKTAEAMQKFIDKGWGAGAGAVAQAGAKGESTGPGKGEDVIADARYYTLTPNGLQAGVAVAGTKYWKSSDLN